RGGEPFLGVVEGEAGVGDRHALHRHAGVGYPDQHVHLLRERHREWVLIERRRPRVLAYLDVGELERRPGHGGRGPGDAGGLLASGACPGGGQVGGGEESPGGTDQGPDPDPGRLGVVDRFQLSVLDPDRLCAAHHHPGIGIGGPGVDRTLHGGFSEFEHGPSGSGSSRLPPRRKGAYGAIKGTVSIRDRFRGVMLGLAVGDCLGRPVEGWAWLPEDYIGEVLTGPRSMVYSDDTAMTLVLVRSLLECGGFSGSHMSLAFAEEYEAAPFRGYGRNVVEVFRRVRAGRPWDQAAARQFGGQGSYGNGAAMRVSPVALWAYPDVEATAALAAETARVTHT